MDANIVSLLLHGCKLARELESGLPTLMGRPDLVSDSCGQIVSVFNAVRERIAKGATSGHQHDQMARADVVDSARSTSVILLHEQQPVGAADSDHGGRAASSSSSRPRKRRDDSNTRTVNVEAPRFGNMEIPPDDGFSWKKYGQKEILGSLFPRSYYKCSHHKLYHCTAKKQVQRLDSDPTTFQVTYRGAHTCHMSSTARSTPPPSQPPATKEMINHPPPPLQLHQSQWLLKATTTVTTAATRDDLYPFVADMADVMFNFGGSGTNSMDMIFSSVTDFGNKD